MSEETLNLNDHVWVRLRDKGRAILREQDAQWSRLFATTHGRLAHAERQETENAGWSRWQLWSLIESFGPALYLGCDPPFETTIRLERPSEHAASNGHGASTEHGTASPSVADTAPSTSSQVSEGPHDRE